MLGLCRRRLASHTLAIATFSPSSTPFIVLVGSSKDLLQPSPSRHRLLSTSTTSPTQLRTRPSPERLKEQARKVERKRTSRQADKLKDLRREEHERALQHQKYHELNLKRTTATELAEGVEPLTEEDLQAMYQGLLLASPEELAQPRVALPPSTSPALLPDPDAPSAEGRLTRLEALQARLDGGEEPKVDSEGVQAPETKKEGIPGLAEKLRASRGGAVEEIGVPKPTEKQLVVGQSVASALLARIRDVSVSAGEESKGLVVPVGAVVRSEWRDLLLEAAETGTAEDVTEGLELMQRNLPINDGKLLTEILAIYARSQRSRDALQLVRYANDKSIPVPVAAHHHLIASVAPQNPSLALQHLYSLEHAGQTPLIETYTTLIQVLVSPSSSPHFVARGWDLFSHSRLVSHHVPSPALFSTMIHACAHAASPSPSRAIDLFTEMTSDNGFAPTSQAYTGVIRACARDGKQEHYFEALRYLRQMLDANVRPTRETFHAVLEGALKHGDLPRARWMLVQMVDAGGELTPDESTLALVFRAYATFQPESRSKSQVEPSSATSTVEMTGQRDGHEAPVQDSVASGVIHFDGAHGDVSYPGPLPTTSDEVMAEARALMTQCIGDSSLPPFPASSSPYDSSPSRVFPALKPNTFLLNAYLSLLARHAPFDHVFVDYFSLTYARLGVRKNRHSYEIAMRRCESAKRRKAGTEFAREVWDEWTAWRKSRKEEREVNEVEDESMATEGQHISAMWSSMIRVLARENHVNEALVLFKTFAARYPPTHLGEEVAALRKAEQKLPQQPSEVRMSSPLYPETRPLAKLPPYLLFSDVSLLHQRLAEVEDKANVGVVKAVCKAYEGALWRAKGVQHGKVRWGKRRENRATALVEKKKLLAGTK